MQRTPRQAVHRCTVLNVQFILRMARVVQKVCQDAQLPQPLPSGPFHSPENLAASIRPLFQGPGRFRLPGHIIRFHLVHNACR
jgi:hypothetical protein